MQSIGGIIGLAQGAWSTTKALGQGALFVAARVKKVWNEAARAEEEMRQVTLAVRETKNFNVTATGYSISKVRIGTTEYTLPQDHEAALAALQGALPEGVEVLEIVKAVEVVVDHPAGSEEKPAAEAPIAQDAVEAPPVATPEAPPVAMPPEEQALELPGIASLTYEPPRTNASSSTIFSASTSSKKGPAPTPQTPPIVDVPPSTPVTVEKTTWDKWYGTCFELHGWESGLVILKVILWALAIFTAGALPSAMYAVASLYDSKWCGKREITALPSVPSTGQPKA